jgi:UDP-N-acetyl-D-galactosamine dehydrogenase
MNKTKKIAVVGLGYVGLPLAVAFAKQYKTIGFDINSARIAELNNGVDITLEVSSKDLEAVLMNATNKVSEQTTGFMPTADISDIEDCTIFIITVPTPIDKNNRPQLGHLKKASQAIGKVLKKGAIVIYESTVYPGATEEECVPELEKASGLIFNTDFFVGYSPERINPGDKERTITKIIKVTSGSTPAVALEIDELYKSIITAGTHLAPSIKVAEAAKVIENSQRDINIAFVNELAKIFNLLDINTQDVLKAAGTKWNFLPFRPGLVGGHCIGVDPYYLAQKAQEVGYHSEIILAGRRLNDAMGKYIASEVIKLIVKADHKVKDAKILVLGITFKENCPDIRNTKVVDVIRELADFNAKVTIYDPWADPKEVQHEYGLSTTQKAPQGTFDAIVLAVAHQEFLGIDLEGFKNDHTIVYDVKGVLYKADGRL